MYYKNQVKHQQLEETKESSNKQQNSQNIPNTQKEKKDESSKYLSKPKATGAINTTEAGSNGKCDCIIY